MQKRQTPVTNSQAAVHESWLVRYSSFASALDLAKAIAIISDNGLPLWTAILFISSLLRSSAYRRRRLLNGE